MSSPITLYMKVLFENDRRARQGKTLLTRMFRQGLFALAFVGDHGLMSREEFVEEFKERFPLITKYIAGTKILQTTDFTVMQADLTKALMPFDVDLLVDMEMSIEDHDPDINRSNTIVRIKATMAPGTSWEDLCTFLSDQDSPLGIVVENAVWLEESEADPFDSLFAI